MRGQSEEQIAEIEEGLGRGEWIEHRSNLDSHLAGHTTFPAGRVSSTTLATIGYSVFTNLSPGHSEQPNRPK